VRELADDGLAGRARALRTRVAGGATAEAVLPEAFALAREAARRALGQRPFDEQVRAPAPLRHDRHGCVRGPGRTFSRKSSAG
jgi:preprotein translocase subunit SecA